MKETPEEADVAVTIPHLTKIQEADMFKALAHKSYKQVGHDFGLHFYYKTDPQVRTAVMNIARKIRKAPELWGISPDAVEVIDEAAASRSIKKNPRIKSDIAIMAESFRDKLDTMRDQVADMIMQKLEIYGKNKKSLDGVSIRDLKDLLAVAIDKSRLMRGESTDNITKLAKLDVDDMSPEEALKVIMKAREALIDNKK